MKKLVAMFATLALVAVSGWAVAQEAPFTSGKEYQPIEPAQPTQTKEGKVEVVELFWYGCPHCYQFEPFLTEWLKDKPENIQFTRMPAVLNGPWELHARAYYTAQTLGILDKMHPAMFHEVHEKKNRMKTPDEVAEFFVAQGVDRDEFDKTFRSFGVATRVNRARAMSKRYRITGVPTVVIAGKYRTSIRDAGSYPAMLEIVEFLVDQEASAAASAEAPQETAAQ